MAEVVGRSFDFVVVSYASEPQVNSRKVYKTESPDKELYFRSIPPKGTILSQQKGKELFTRIIEYKLWELELPIRTYLDALGDCASKIQETSSNLSEGVDGSSESKLNEIDSLIKEIRVFLNDCSLFAKSTKKLNHRIEELDKFRIRQISLLSKITKNYGEELVVSDEVSKKNELKLSRLLNSLSSKLSLKSLNYKRGSHGNHTPLMLAIDLGDPKLFNQLIQDGCSFDAETFDYLQSVKLQNPDSFEKIMTNLPERYRELFFRSVAPEGKVLSKQKDKELFTRIIEYKLWELELPIRTYLDALEGYASKILETSSNLSEGVGGTSVGILNEIDSLIKEIGVFLDECSLFAKSRKKLNHRIDELDMFRVRQLSLLSKITKNYGEELVIPDKVFKKNELKLSGLLNSLSSKLSFNSFNYKRGSHGNHTPLMLAIDLGDPKLFKKLIQDGCYFDAETFDYLLSVQLQNTDSFEKIMTNLPDVFRLKFQGTVKLTQMELFSRLKEKVEKRDSVLVNHLINCLRGYSDKSVLDECVSTIKKKCLEKDYLSLDHFHRCLEIFGDVRSEKLSILHAAVKSNNLDVVKYYLLDTQGYALEGLYCPSSFDFSEGDLVSGSGECIETVLSVAIKNNNLEMVKALLETAYQRDPETASLLVNQASLYSLKTSQDSSESPFILDVSYPIKDATSTEIKELLLSYGANQSMLKKVGEHFSVYTPLMVAIDLDNPELLQRLVDNGCCLDLLTLNYLLEAHKRRPEIYFQIVKSLPTLFEKRYHDKIKITLKELFFEIKEKNQNNERLALVSLITCLAPSGQLDYDVLEEVVSFFKQKCSESDFECIALLQRYLDIYPDKETIRLGILYDCVGKENQEIVQYLLNYQRYSVEGIYCPTDGESRQLMQSVVSLAVESDNVELTRMLLSNANAKNRRVATALANNPSFHFVKKQSPLASGVPFELLVFYPLNEAMSHEMKDLLIRFGANELLSVSTGESLCIKDCYGSSYETHVKNLFSRDLDTKDLQKYLKSNRPELIKIEKKNPVLLHTAISMGKLQLVSTLLNEGISCVEKPFVSLNGTVHAPIAYALDLNQLDVAKRLLQEAEVRGVQYVVSDAPTTGFSNEVPSELLAITPLKLAHDVDASNAFANSLIENGASKMLACMS